MDRIFAEWLRQRRARGAVVWRCSRLRHVTEWDISAAQLPIGDVDSAGFGTAEMTRPNAFHHHRFSDVRCYGSGLELVSKGTCRLSVLTCHGGVPRNGCRTHALAWPLDDTSKVGRLRRQGEPRYRQFGEGRRQHREV